MAINFPASPTNNQSFGGFAYDATAGAWKRSTTRQTISSSATPPANPV